MARSTVTVQQAERTEKLCPGHRISDHAVDRVDKINGKTLYNQQIEVSADGKALKVTIHIPGRDKPDWMVFDRE